MPNWLFQLAAILLLAAALFLLYRALLHDRPKGRRRCPRCWYELTPPTLHCPECGRLAKSERATRRTRRHRKAAAAALLLVLSAYAAHLGPAIRSRGLIPALPTSILILFPFDAGNLHGEFTSAPTFPWEPTLWKTLRARADNALLAQWQLELLTWRFNRSWGARRWPRQRAVYTPLLAAIEAPVSLPAYATLPEFAAHVEQSIRLPVHLDLPALAELGIDPNTPLLTGRVRQHSAAAALSDLPRALGAEWVLTWTLSPDGVLITKSDRAPGAIAAVHVVSDLLAHAPCLPGSHCRGEPIRAEDVVDLITATIEFDRWVSNGGDAHAIAAFQDRIYLRASPRVHLQVEDLLDRLRDAWLTAGADSASPSRFGAAPTAVLNVADLVEPSRCEPPHVCNPRSPCRCDTPRTCTRERAERLDEVLWILTGTVHEDAWRDNGGDQAAIFPLADVLVVQAPPDTLAGVRELVVQLRTLLAQSRKPPALAPEDECRGFLGQLRRHRISQIARRSRSDQ